MALRGIAFIGLSIAAFACSDPPTEVIETTPGQFVSVTAGRYHACALDTLGRGWCWGDNSYGQSGVPANICLGCSIRPNLLESSLRFTKISAGSTHTCGIATDSTVYCWGDNYFGQLGISGVGACATGRICTPAPVAVTGGLKFKSITSGAYGTCAITVGDVLKCWGYQGFNSTLINAAPATVRYPATGDSLWAAVGHTDGGLNGCGLTIGGVAACWGQNFYGQLGIGTVNNQRTNPVAIALSGIVKTISSGSGFSCALTNLGDAYCWGISYGGGLGLGADVVPVACATPQQGATCNPTPLKVVGNHKFAQLAVGTDGVCAIEISGQTYCWGANNFSAIGSTALGNSGVAPSPFVSGNGTIYTSIAVGTFFTCGVLPDKNISCWGSNLYGQLGRSTVEIVTAMAPVRIRATAP